MSTHKFAVQEGQHYASLECVDERGEVYVNPDLIAQRDNDGVSFLCKACGESILLPELVQMASEVLL